MGDSTTSRDGRFSKSADMVYVTPFYYAGGRVLTKKSEETRIKKLINVLVPLLDKACVVWGRRTTLAWEGGPSRTVNRRHPDSSHGEVACVVVEIIVKMSGELLPHAE